MLLFGHPWVESRFFAKVFSIEEIKSTEPKDIVLLEPLNVSIELARYCHENDIEFAVSVGSIHEAIVTNALGAGYILAQFEMAIALQKVADEYMFDTRVLVLVESEKAIESMARFGIDGVVFPKAIKH